MKIKRVIEIEEKDLERIREIVERENKTALSVTTRGTAYITIADSKPYEEKPQGEWIDYDMNNDLISRSALLADFKERNIWGKDILEAIDNAPTVEPERPRGEWKETGYATGALGITYRQTQCSNCGWEHALPMWWNFCPNCGADMRRGSDSK